MTTALVNLSGGADSTICAVIAKQRFDSVYGITFDYGQRHIIEIQSAIEVAEALNIQHEIIDLGDNILKSMSPLVSASVLGTYQDKASLPTGVENTFVAGRNILFLTIAGNRASHLNIDDIFIGVCQEDFGGYYDCRQVFIDKMSDALNEGIYGQQRLTLHTPLMNMTKAESIKLAHAILGDDFNKIFALTHTCYAGIHGGCGKCHACILRDAGFKEAGIDDPLWRIR